MTVYEEGVKAAQADAETARRELGHVPPPADTNRMIRRIPGPDIPADVNAMIRLAAQAGGPALVPLVPEWLLDPEWAAGWRDGAADAYSQDQLSSATR